MPDSPSSLVRKRISFRSCSTYDACNKRVEVKGRKEVANVFHSSFWDEEERHRRCGDRSCFPEMGKICGQGICSAFVRNGEDNKVIAVMDERHAVLEKSSLWTRGTGRGTVRLRICILEYGESHRRMIPGPRRAVADGSTEERRSPHLRGWDEDETGDIGEFELPNAACL